MIARFFILGLSLSSPILASAHGHHGVVPGDNILHYLTEMQHVLPILIGFMIIAGVTLRVFRKKTSVRTPVKR